MHLSEAELWLRCSELQLLAVQWWHGLLPELERHFLTACELARKTISYASTLRNRYPEYFVPWISK